MIYPIRTIVAAVADVGTEDPLLRPVLRLAERTGASLHLVHAFEFPSLMWDAYARMGYVAEDALREYERGIEAELEARVQALAPGGRVHCHALAGPAAPMVREVAEREEADLLVVGATRRGTLARAVLGTTAQRVLRDATVPVLVLRDPLPERLDRVLLTTDLSPFSAGVHEAGLDLLDTLFEGERPELRSLLVVWHSMEPSPPLRRELLVAVPRAELATFLGERRERGRPVEGVVRYGDPAREIVEEASQWGADLVVVGTHGRPAPQRWLLGSVAEATIRSAPGNALVIPARVEQLRTLPVPVPPATRAAPVPSTR